MITKSIITKQNGEKYYHKEIYLDKDFYINNLIFLEPKPILKPFDAREIKINRDYKLAEFLPDRQILPDLYDDFEEDDIKSLEKSLEKSIDKTFHIY